MSSKIVNILIVIIAVEISIFLGVYLLSFEVFWFYLGMTLTLTITFFILIFKIVLTSTQSEYSDEIIIESINSGIIKELNTISSNSPLERVVMEAKDLNTVVLAQDTNSETRVLELTNQFGSFVEDIKSRIEQERVQFETNELSRKMKDEYISDIKKTLTFELERLNAKFEEKIDKFSTIEDILNSRLENFEKSILKGLNHKFESALGNLTQKPKIELPDQVKVEEDIETSIETEVEKIEPITTSVATIHENEKFDAVTEDLINFVEEKYQISRDESIELLQKIEAHLGKKLSNLQHRIYLKDKSIDDLTKILEKEPRKEKVIEKAEPITTSSPAITSENEKFDEDTEDLIFHVERKYLISRDESIELLQKIEVHMGKNLTNTEYRIYFNDKSLDDLIKVLEKGPKSDDKEESINLMGREIEILKINEDIQEIEHNGTKFKMQKTMSGKSLDDLLEMEERIKKFFKNREILIVYCKNIEKFFIYYKT